MTEYERFVLDFHARFPGITSQMYGRAPGHEQTPYDLLVGMIPAGASDVHVLDLGCGDGYLLQLLSDQGLESPTLIGVDMSAEELEAARQRGISADLRCERTQSLSVGEAQMDFVFCHLILLFLWL